MSSRSLSAILSRSNGHDALLELLDLDEDVRGLKSWLIKIGNRIADNEPMDETARDALVRIVGRAVVITHKLDAAYDALGR